MTDTASPDPTRKRVLLVDDEKSVLTSLRRLLRKEPWEILLTSSASEALQILAAGPIHLIVSDLQIDDMDGTVFLRQVKEDYPQTVRVILTGYAERKSVTEAFTEADVYQLIAKPWDDEELKQVLRRALGQGEPSTQESEALGRLLKEIDTLPSLPNVYLDLRAALEASEEGSTDQVAEVISQDPAIAARLLRIANSAFFGQSRRVETIPRAIGLVGLAMIENIVLSTSVFRDLQGDDIPGFDQNEFWRHSLATGFIARAIEDRRSQDRRRAELAMLAGTLHDLGKLVFARFYADAYIGVVDAAQRDAEFVSVKEQQLLGLSHMTLGGHLADWWNLPPAIVEAIQWHSDPSGASVNAELAGVVHLADVFVHRASIGQSGNGRIPDVHESAGAVLAMSADELREMERAIIEKMAGEDLPF